MSREPTNLHFLAGTFPCLDSENVIAFRNYIENHTPFNLEAMEQVPIVQAALSSGIQSPKAPQLIPCFMFFCSTDSATFKECFGFDYPYSHSMEIQKIVNQKFTDWISNPKWKK